ncbi:MAG: hypothetical protein A3H27_11645 [Acidobacteria bacterium RIFCSPLOWO2_02_FULL_59_13]|nr:MAG: hypothetical protein A3H27_11645 [Acidobacteria bacterium RIFCSPLOWO2_02_FULL_59_13]
MKTLLIGAVLLALAACGGEAPSAAPGATPSAAPGAAPRTTQRSAMELLEARQSATQDAINIVGQVKNISGKEVSGVTVLCDFQDSSGKSIRVEQGYLETDPLAADATSAFKISTRYDANIKRFNVTFREMFGGALATKDSRKQ